MFSSLLNTQIYCNNSWFWIFWQEEGHEEDEAPGVEESAVAVVECIVEIKEEYMDTEDPPFSPCGQGIKNYFLMDTSLPVTPPFCSSIWITQKLYIFSSKVAHYLG